jgi:uncharacterized membrane protein (DUF373 family)
MTDPHDTAAHSTVTPATTEAGSAGSSGHHNGTHGPEPVPPEILARLFRGVIAPLDWLVNATEIVVAALLALAGIWVLIDVIVFMATGVTATGPVTDTVHAALDRILLFFIVVELFRIAIAYIQHQDVMHTVIEAGLVAVVRKIVLFNFADYGLQGAAAYSVLLIVLVIAFFAFERTRLSGLIRRG